MIRPLALLLATSMLVQAGPLQDGIATFREAYREWNGDKFWKATELFKKEAAANPNSATAQLWMGTARFHRMLQIQSRPQTPELRAVAELDRDGAIEALERAVELDQGLAEAHAMLGTLYGMKIDGAMSGMRYGRKVQKHQKLALKHGEKNPRVHYLLGVGLLRTAKKDKDRDKALVTLKHAESLYAAEAKQKRPALAPAWGRDACLAFIGEAFSSLHNPEMARAYYRKALALRPNNQMAKAGLAKLK